MQRRNTNQRQIVYDAIEFLGHADTEKLINYINSHYENISLATIYRNLNILQEENQIKKVKVVDLDVYETIKEKHYHFKCRVCGEVIDIKPEDIEIFGKLESIYGHKIEEMDVNFTGVCRNCQKK